MPYRIHFFGNFRLLAPDGADIAPSSVNHRALLALLAESGDMRRARRWIETKLWSDRAQKQASGSLREALSKTRKSLGDHAHILKSNRQDIWLDMAQVETDLAPGSPLRAPGRQFLEGIDVRDPEFEDWLSEMRTRHDTHEDFAPPRPSVGTPANIAGILVNSRTGTANSHADRLAAQMVADYVATNFEDWFNAWIQSDGSEVAGSLGGNAADLEVVCDTVRDGGICIIYVRVVHSQTGRVLFAGYRSFRGQPLEAVDADTIAGIAHSAAVKVASKLPIVIGVERPESIAAGLANFGKQRLLTFEPERMDEAFGLMSQAQKAQTHSVFVAWQAFIRMAQLVDSVCDDREAKREELDALTRKALELSTDNALTISLVAIARNMGQDQISEAATLARQALKINPKSLFARQAMALAHSAAGDIAGAYRLSSSCQTLLPDDETRHLWDLYHSLVCIAAGNHGEALTAAERASVRCPEFAAPRRQQLGLLLSQGHYEEAKIQFEKLREKEPELSLDRFLNDPDYPTDTLRRSGLIHRSMLDALD